MNINVTFRHFDATDAVKLYAKEKVSKLQKFLREPLRARVTVDVENKVYSCEIELKAGSGHFVAHERAADLYACIDKVTDKLERQVTGAHSTQVSRRKRADSAGTFAAAQFSGDPNDKVAST